MSKRGEVVALVSCVSAKKDQAAAAGDIYTSAWFKKAKRYAVANSNRWYILSAKHGLLAPHEVIEPYEKTLNKMGAQARQEWSERVGAQLQSVLKPGDTALFLAGARYREGLERELIRNGVNLVVPMAGMRIGEQLAWLTRHNAA